MTQALPMMAVLVDASANGAGRSRQGHVATCHLQKLGSGADIATLKVRVFSFGFFLSSFLFFLFLVNQTPSQRKVENNMTVSIYPNRTHEATRRGDHQMPFPVPAVVSLGMLIPEWM